MIEPTGHVNQREPAHAPFNAPTKVDSTGWAPTTEATNEWRPGCDCAPDELNLQETESFLPIPCTVLDSFGGAGTVGLVADRLNRDAILIELKPEYAEMARRRIESEAPMFASVELHQ